MSTATIDGLEQRCQEQADRSGADYVDSTFGTRGQGHREPSWSDRDAPPAPERAVSRISRW